MAKYHAMSPLKMANAPVALEREVSGYGPPFTKKSAMCKAKKTSKERRKARRPMDWCVAARMKRAVRMTKAKGKEWRRMYDVSV
jgi:hypothetical protein